MAAVFVPVSDYKAFVAQLMPEDAGFADGQPPAGGLKVGAADAGDLDADEDLAGSGHGKGPQIEPDLALLPDQRPHAAHHPIPPA